VKLEESRKRVAVAVIGAKEAGTRTKIGKINMNTGFGTNNGGANSMSNKSRYLDVMTVSASHGSTLSKSRHQMLFVEPIILPNLSHLKVDKATEAAESCLFYPSGQKSVAMRSEIDAAVRGINSETAIEAALQTMSNSRPKSNRESIIVPFNNTSKKSSRSNSIDSKTPPIPAPAPMLSAKSKSQRSSKGLGTSSKSLIFPAGDTKGYDPVEEARLRAETEFNVGDKKKEPLYQSKKSTKEMKQLFKKIRDNESKIVSTVKTRV
jgi:hypothetical protein